MISRENRVLAVAFVLYFLALGTGAALGLEGAAFAAALIVGVPILGPQLYLAATGDDELPPETRVRTGVLLSVFLLGPMGASVTGGERRMIWGFALALFLGLLAYEFRSGYRHRTADR
ncbi:hypothetical protein [Natrinema salaciae]|uniref:SPW repeat-containing protein n=1 Tax=Natrinema salaciae TaxID=1186196 RepID=A0A1H9AXR4_9EURY|nr:hypothetical protein [Natrinema salaciae]SEP80768.1 hypothetical protein SAMN04489841_0560 [Natrinema salaciae]